jgi:hypothetical protein
MGARSCRSNSSARLEATMQFYEYKGFTIYPAPKLVAGLGYWKVELLIKHNNTFKKYGDERRLFTKGEAVFHAIQHGKKLIDDGIVLLDEAV